MKLNLRRAGAVAAVAIGAMVVTPAHAKNVLRWASQGDALTFDPHSQNEGPTNAANLQVYEPLIRRDAKLAKIPGQKLFDQIIPADASLLDEALTFAKKVADKKPLPCIRNLP